MSRSIEVVGFRLFFASHSLSTKGIESLVEFIKILINSENVAKLHMVYVNSSDSRANLNYERFMFKMGLRSDSKRLSSDSMIYQFVDLKESKQ